VAAASAAAARPLPVTDTPAAARKRATITMSTDELKAALAAVEADREADVDLNRTTDVMPVIDLEPPPAGDVGGGRTTVMDAIDISMITGEAPSDVGAGGSDDDEAEISIEQSGEISTESSGEISGDLEITPSGKVNGQKPKGKAKSKRAKKR
jgi:hypothetical protein